MPEDWRDQIQATVTFPVPTRAVYEFQEAVLDEPLIIRGAPYLYLVAAKEDQEGADSYYKWAFVRCLMRDAMTEQAQYFALADDETKWVIWDYDLDPTTTSLAAILEYTTDVDPNSSEPQDTEAEGLEVSVEDIIAEEDGELKVIIDAQLVDTDGSETVSVASVCGLPEQDCVGPFNLGSSNTLNFDLPTNWNGEGTLTVTVRTTESSSGATAEATATATYYVTSVNDAPSIMGFPSRGFQINRGEAMGVAGIYFSDVDFDASLGTNMSVSVVTERGTTTLTSRSGGLIEFDCSNPARCSDKFDRFTYEAPSTAGSDSVTVTINDNGNYGEDGVEGIKSYTLNFTVN
jgi:hypothetical protein